jgi:rhodanese-related sulfurtransferase
VKSNTDQPAQADRPRAIKRVLLEAVLVTVAGIAFAAAVNEISPRGLALTRDYFPGATRRSSPALFPTNRVQSFAGTSSNAPSAVDLLAARLKANGLQLADSNQVVKLFHDPRRDQELVVFVDGRNDEEYQEGHIPGAYQLDHYRLDRYLAEVLPACQTAEQIVVYCNGGDCEDGEFTALTLSKAGIPSTNLLVYVGGMSEWATNGLPVELGARRSGNLRHTTK